MSVRGVWGNIHILLVPEASKFRFSYAVWYDEDLGIDQGYRVSLRSWSTSDDDASGDRYLSLDEATVTSVKRCLDETWAGLLRLSMQPMVHADRIRVGVTAADLPRSEPVMPRSVRGLVGKAPIWASRRNGQLRTHNSPNSVIRRGLAFFAGLQIQSAGAVTTAKRQVQAKASADAATKNVQKPMYFVDFRARTAASYGHAFTWCGRTDQKQVEVAGLHPASDSIIRFILGHVVPVPSETKASYGDLDEQYLTASYRVLMDEAQAGRVFGYIKHLQATSPLWHAAKYNCVAFIQNIARYMGLQVPGNHLLYPEEWVNQLRALNGGSEIAWMPLMAESQAHA
jgi:hypothetical protein